MVSVVISISYLGCVGSVLLWKDPSPFSAQMWVLPARVFDCMKSCHIGFDLRNARFSWREGRLC